MKRCIKITKEQAKMIKEMHKQPAKVVKISQEQYNRLFQETEELNEYMSAASSIKRNFKNSLSKSTMKEISNLKEMKFVKISHKTYKVEYLGVHYDITPNNYSYYKDYDIAARFIDVDGLPLDSIDYHEKWIPNLKVAKSFIKDVSKENAELLKKLKAERRANLKRMKNTELLKKLNEYKLSKQTKKEISKLKESYSAFIKELYSLKEGEGDYDELYKFMEIKGMVNNRKISKEYFMNNKDVVMEVICSGLSELDKGCSNYEAMEVMEGKLAEFTTAASSGAYSGLFSPISFKPNLTISEEDEIEEATTTASVGGSYATPAFLPSKFWGNAGKKGKAPVNKGVTHKKTAWNGGKFVKVKDKCRTFPYCNQGADAIELYGE